MQYTATSVATPALAVLRAFNRRVFGHQLQRNQLQFAASERSCQFGRFECQSVVRAPRGSAAPGIQSVGVAAKGVNCASSKGSAALDSGFGQRGAKLDAFRNVRTLLNVEYPHTKLSQRRVHMQVRGKSLQARQPCHQGQSQSQPNHSFKRTSAGVPVSAA
jgi:hypothetical protein